MVKVYDGLVSCGSLSWRVMKLKSGGMYHAVAGELGVGLENAVCGGVVASCVHGIGASLVKRRRKSDITRRPASNGDFGHVCGVQLLMISFSTKGI